MAQVADDTRWTNATARAALEANDEAAMRWFDHARQPATGPALPDAAGQLESARLRAHRTQG